MRITDVIINLFFINARVTLYCNEGRGFSLCMEDYIVMEPSHQVYGEQDRGHPMWLRVVSSCVCVLSVVGSAAIILSYALVRNMRSKARELLVHISAMDLLYTTANLVGLALPYREHLIPGHNGSSPSEYKVYHYICLTQAFVAIYGTVGSILWTIGLAVYLYYRMVVMNDAITRKVLAVLYIVCYGIPLYVCLWLLFTHGLGYSPDVSSGAGWCSLNTANAKDGEHSVLLLIMTYDMWIFLGIMLLLPLYLSIYAEVKDQVSKISYMYITNQFDKFVLLLLLLFTEQSALLVCSGIT